MAYAVFRQTIPMQFHLDSLLIQMEWTFARISLKPFFNLLFGKG